MMFHKNSCKKHFFTDKDMQIIVNDFCCEYLMYCL